MSIDDLNRIHHDIISSKNPTKVELPSLVTTGDQINVDKKKEDTKENLEEEKGHQVTAPYKLKSYRPSTMEFKLPDVTNDAGSREIQSLSNTTDNVIKTDPVL